MTDPSAAPESSRPSPRGGWPRWLLLDFGVLFFLAHVAVAFLRGGVVLEDPSTGWHLAAGRLILETGAIPRVDAFSFTAAGREWLDYYWLFQVACGWLERLGGLPLVATVWTIAYASIPFVLYRTAIRGGASPLAAFIVVPMGYAVLLPHALARPHVLTYLFLAVLLGRLQDVRTGRRPSWSLWWLPLLMVVWVNVHGGFVAGLAAVAAVAATAIGRHLVTRDTASRRDAMALVVLAVAMAIATLVNPYGIRLHEQVLEHLGMPSTGLFDEFRSPDFRNGVFMARYFELLVLALIAVGATFRLRASAEEAVLLLGTLHAALTSLRDMNLFVLVAVPLLARGVTAMLEAWRPREIARWRRIADAQEEARLWRVQLPIAAILLTALAVRGAVPFPTTLDGLQLSPGAVAHIGAHPERFERPFNTIGLGGHLTYRFWPSLHVFIDDRTVIFGEEFVSQVYLPVLYGNRGWEAILDGWTLESAIVSTWAPCFERFRTSPRWRADYVDERIGLFVRAPT